MPFLIPAIVSGLSDVLILILQEHREEAHLLISQFLNGRTVDNSDDDTSSSSILSVYHVQYLAFAAVLRLLLLLFPLPYHSYTGTAIRFPFCYQLFYAITLTLVLIHMLALCMIDPDSLATLLPSTTTSTNDVRFSEGTSTMASLATLHQQLSRSCWWILLLSVASVFSHIVMLIHVRSTAPSIEYMPYQSLGNRKKKMVYYYASRQSVANAAFVDSEDMDSDNEGLPATFTTPSTPTKNKSNENVNANGDLRDKQGVNPLLASGAHEDLPTSPMQKLSSQYDDFVSEMQTRISLLKQDWTSKLDDFTQRHLSIITPGSNNGTNRIIGGHQHNNPLLPLTPFRVLLQLFAYQDVIDSGKLDAVFEMDNGQSMTFFVPQLLSFLLHGAYYEADPTKLEAWILDKCSKHLHFAHRCYWFLKAWSLEQPYQPAAMLTKSPTPPHSTNSLQGQGGFDFHGNGNSPSEFGLSHSISQSSLVGGTNPRTPANRHSRSNSWSSLTGGMQSNTNANTNGSNQKLLPEEQAVVEDLMIRVSQCGEAAARILHYGLPPQSTVAEQRTVDGRKGDKREEAMSNGSDTEAMTSNHSSKNPIVTEHLPSGLFWDQEVGEVAKDAKKSPCFPLVPDLVLTPEMEANLPIDPSTGFPSQRHLETLTASHRFGFMPWDDALKQQESLQASTLPNTCSFEATPRFLDALLAIADGLFLVPREQRKKQLRLQLQALEVELLPSNAIYVPISNLHHRVWRIVAEESIALNTKERVPCIILLEVVDYNESSLGDAASTNGRESEAMGDLDDPLQSWDLRRSKEKRSLELPKLELPKLGMPKKAYRTRSVGDQTLGSRDSNDLETAPTSSFNANTSGSLQFSLPYYTMMGGLTESEVVNHWRYARRDPHRGESILDRMTSSLPLDMNRVKERIHQFRDKQGAIFHDLLPRTNSDDFSTETGKEDAQRGRNKTKKSPDSEIAAFLRNDAGDGDTSKEQDPEACAGDGNGSRDVSPVRDPSDVSMGQWTSPVAEKAKARISINDEKGSSATSAETPEVRRKESYQRREDRVSTAYGSTCNGRGESYNVMDGRPPRSNARTTSDDAGNRTPRDGTRKPPQVVFRENWQAKEDRLRRKSAFGSLAGWRLLPILVKANDDLRQEQLASQLIQKMAFILARERVPVWLCPYEIIAITDRGGIVEAIPDTISLDSLKRNDPNFVDLKTFFHSYFGDNVDDLADAKSNFVESLAAYSIVTFLLQVKDRHNGNILLDNRGHLIHIDFGFFFLSSPGKNTGFESAPFKLTRDFVEVLGGPESHAFRTFRELCVRSFLVLRRHCMEIILLVEMLKSGNEDLSCFLGRPDDAIKGLRERFRLDLSDRACREYVHSLIDESLENWRTNWYDRYQRYCVGVL